MIVLSLLTAPVEVPLPDVGPGVSVTLRRLTSPQLALAHARAQDAVRQLGAGMVSAGEYGLDSLNPLSPQEMLQAGHLIGAVETAMAALVSWRGICLEDGSPAPINRQTLSILLQAEAIDRVLRAEITAACRILAVTTEPKDPTEGNGSGPSPAGSTAIRPDMTAAPTTAPAARPPTPPAPAANPARRAATVPRSRTPRAPRKARPSGD